VASVWVNLTKECTTNQAQVVDDPLDQTPVSGLCTHSRSSGPHLCTHQVGKMADLVSESGVEPKDDSPLGPSAMVPADGITLAPEVAAAIAEAFPVCCSKIQFPKNLAFLE
jgi:hypothetical protein